MQVKVTPSIATIDIAVATPKLHAREDVPDIIRLMRKRMDNFVLVQAAPNKIIVAMLILRPPVKSERGTSHMWRSPPNSASATAATVV
jgi:hypothetical protein